MSWNDDVRKEAAAALESFQQEAEENRLVVAANTVLYHMRVTQLVIQGIELPPEVAHCQQQALYRLQEAAMWMETALDGVQPAEAEVALVEDGTDDQS